MKYMASTSPITMPKMTINRPWASGWRDTPWMVALPPRPSPIAAPMAPPPRASPAPISAPATAIAWFMRRILLSMGGGQARCLRAVQLLFQALAGVAEVHDRQQHEDERLEAADEEHIEELPEHDREPADGQRQLRQQVQHQNPGEDVAEEPQGEGDRLDDLLDDVQWDEEHACKDRQLERLGKAVKIAAQAQHPERVPLHHQDHHYPHRQRLVEVGIGRVDV